METLCWFILAVVIFQKLVGWAGIGIILTGILILCLLAGFETVKRAWEDPDSL